MVNKLKLWDQRTSWEEAEKAWDEKALEASKKAPLKKLATLPSIPGIAEGTGRFLKWKSLKYMATHDQGRKILKHFLKHPLKYALRLFRSSLKKKSYVRDGDFFFYGLKNEEEFLKGAMGKDALVVVGFSYCQKPHECPEGRFTDRCRHSLDSPICQQCDIGKVVHALPQKAIPLFIPTIHYIGDQIFTLIHKYPKKRLFFLITACELTLEMFGDLGNMVAIQGVGIRLDGRICNTMKAFELSEEGIKPGLTVLTTPTQKRLLDLIKNLRSGACV